MKSSPSEESKTWTTSQVALATLFVVCVLLTFWLLYTLRVVLFLFFVAIVIGTAIRPAVEWLHRRGVSRAAGVIAIYIFLTGLLIGFLAMILPLIVNQTTQISQNLPAYYKNFQGALTHSNNLLLQNIGSRLPSDIALLVSRNPNAGEVLNQVSQTFLYTNLVFKGILSTFAIFLLAYYWTQESGLVTRALLGIFPLQQKKNVREFLQLVDAKLGGYIRGEVLLCTAVGLAAFIAYAIIGLPYVLVLGIFAGVMEMVPIFGPTLGALPAFLVAISLSPGKAIWVVVAVIIIQLLENTVLAPRIMKNSLGVNPIIVLLSLIAFSSVFGIAGGILALPLAAIIQLLVSRVVLMAAQSAREAQNREAQIGTLLDESQKLMQTIYEASNKTPSFQELPETDRLEIYTLAKELNQVLGEVKKEGEKL